MWANIWAAVSALATVATFVVALLAMNRWSKQDELKVKLEFKLAVSAYAYCLVSLPGKLSPKSVKIANEDMSDELTDLLAKATHAWFATEGLLDSNKPVSDAWEYICYNHKFFVSGICDSNGIHENCSIIMGEKFVFK
ncbi:TPA: hypothetical protein QCI16_003079 [Enterobacter ludwigii]|uniref:hypothetical protein n=1 Tax=Enterobacter sp. 200527-13 TaxID=2995131 RepID=UPI0022C13492|nr:hypothetical protein [Enterobacter sp. 200527-13]GLH24114.1 hypothetical protein ENT52713_15100 [Enterobacter sp. 200527-13]HDR2588933.1 hypothetical protein [Enterobacter ludwigii]HDR2598901.1 hypothetical protein [Enterobacter ludwigii]